MQIPILQGIYNDKEGFRTQYPINLIAEPKNTGINNGYLRVVDGIKHFMDGPGKERGGINWNNACYRVMGSKLIKVNSNGSYGVLGDVGNNSDNPVTLCYGFDRLAIASDLNLFYYNSSIGLVQVTDPDLGNVLDVIWVDGYFVCTDGEFIVVTELLDPLSVNNLKYGSSEADPDPIVALLKVRNEICALNRHTIEYFDNVGGQFFPFNRIEGAQIPKGCIGTKACCVGEGVVFFVGGGINEQCGVYLGNSGQAQKISTQEVDKLINEYSQDVLAGIEIEYRKEDSHSFLYIHLPSKTLLFDIGASKELKGTPVWSILASDMNDSGYYARHFVWCYNKWLLGHSSLPSIGYLSKDTAKHWDAGIIWEFNTLIIYGEGKNAVFHKLELVTTATQDSTKDSIISTQYSNDGRSWSQLQSVVQKAGIPVKRKAWFRQGMLCHWRIQKFRGNAETIFSIARLEADLELLAW